MPPHRPLNFLLVLLLPLAAVSAAASLPQTGPPKPAAAAAAASGVAVAGGMKALMDVEEELESVELCSSSGSSPTVIRRRDGGEISVKNLKRTKLALVNYTEGLMTESFCCSSKSGVRCTFKYKPMYYVLCAFTGISCGLLLLLGLVALFYKYKYRPWEFFSDLMSRPLLARSGLSIRSDPATGPASEADTAVDSVVDGRQPAKHGQTSSQCHDDRMLPDIF